MLIRTGQAGPFFLPDVSSVAILMCNLESCNRTAQFACAWALDCCALWNAFSMLRPHFPLGPPVDWRALANSMHKFKCFSDQQMATGPGLDIVSKIYESANKWLAIFHSATLCIEWAAINKLGLHNGYTHILYILIRFK